MRFLKWWWKKAVIPTFIGMVGLGIVLGLSFRLYTQWKDIGNLSKQIQALPTATAILKPTTPALPTPVEPDKKVALEKDRIVLENNITNTIVQSLGGLFFVVTAYFTWRNLRVAEDKQVTERFSNAVEQLGSDKIEVRLGGIYSLERITKDSPKDEWTIIEILTSFIREKSPLDASKQSFLAPYLLQQKQSSEENLQFNTTTDVQAALTVIGRLKPEESYYQRINLSRTDLSGADLSGADLSGVDLSGADLSGADLSGIDFMSANLSIANLSNANLNSADLSFANFRGASLMNANLSNAILRGAKLHETIVNEANLSNANLSRAELSDANLMNTNLSNAILLSTDLRKVQNLTPDQLEGNKPPLLCNVALPQGFKVDPDRDCNLLPEEFVKRYPGRNTLEETKKSVDTLRRMEWRQG
jgi:uncharacterized protein YjbI with pentapeptide repeats